MIETFCGVEPLAGEADNHAELVVAVQLKVPIGLPLVMATVSAGTICPVTEIKLRLFGNVSSTGGGVVTVRLTGILVVVFTEPNATTVIVPL